MRRLTSSTERGATAVVVALVIVMLLGFAAIAIDLGAAWSDRKQLQNGADAAALAIAQACAGGDCGDYNGTAFTLAQGNKFGQDVSDVEVDLDLTGRQVTVRTLAPRNQWFSPILGAADGGVAAQATAIWGPVGGATLPVTLSWCDWMSQTGLDSGNVPDGGGELTIVAAGFKNNDPKCNRGAHNEIPGGFGFLSGTACKSSINGLGNAGGYTGNTMKSGCTAANWVALQGKTVLLPLFDGASRDTSGCQANGNSACNLTYHITGFAAITITAYCLPVSSGHVGWPAGFKCNGSKYSIVGRFVNYVSLDDGLSGGNPSSDDFGVTFVRLSN